MSATIKKTMSLMLLGTSLTSGRLATPDNPWDLALLNAMRAHPNCKGPIRVINIGKGGQTSDFGLSQSQFYAAMRPTHLLTEDFGINDCAIGPVTLAQAAANLNGIYDNFQAANPAIVIAHQTMSPASAGDNLRTQLASYYDQGTTISAGRGITTVDNYASWPKPLDPAITVNNDGLHPVWANAFQLYSFPNILAWAEQAMANFWG